MCVNYWTTGIAPGMLLELALFTDSLAYLAFSYTVPLVVNRSLQISFSFDFLENQPKAVISENRDYYIQSE